MSTLLLSFVLLSGFMSVLILAIECLGALRERQFRRWMRDREDAVNLVRAESLLGSKQSPRGGSRAVSGLSAGDAVPTSAAPDGCGAASRAGVGEVTIHSVCVNHASSTPSTQNANP